ncbi:MAG: hypothetical protein U0176_01020 [Bacteroidia bacterium]
MNGEYLSYYPQFESNQVLTSAHLNELRQYLDEQIRLTRSQLIGVGVCAGLTFKVLKPTKIDRNLDPSLNFDFGIRVFAGFGVSSEGFMIAIEGEKALPELPTEDPYRSSRYSDYVKYRKYVDQSPDLYWHYGKEANPKQIAITELLTVRDAEQLILDGVPKNTIHDLIESQVKDKVLVLYLELQDIALRSCVGKDCDNKGSKRHITPRILLIERDAKAGIDGTTKPAEIVVTGLDGLLMRQPYPVQMRAPRLISGLQANSTPLQSIISYSTLGNGYLTAIDQWQNTLANEIAASHERYSPFLGLTDRDVDQIGLFKGMSFPVSHAQYGLDLLKDLTRGLNEFNLLAYELKRDVCNEGYIFPRHLMLGTVPHDPIYNSGHYDKYRNYFIQFGLTPAQDRKLRQAQILFVRILQQIKHYVQIPSNLLSKDGEARMVPSQEDEYLVGKGSIPDYYTVSQPLAQSWDPDRYLDGLHDEVLSFEPETYSGKPHVRMPFCYDIDDKPFLRVQNMLNRDVNDCADALGESMQKNNLAFDVVAVKFGKVLNLSDLRQFVMNIPEWAQLESQYHGQRAALHALVANLRGQIRAHDIKGLQKGLALPMDLMERYMDQTPVMENIIYALGANTLLDFVAKDGLPTMVKGAIPNFAADGLSDLYQYMYTELRTFAQYLMLLLNHQRDVLLRQTPDPCDLTERHATQFEIEQALAILGSFLDDRLWVQFQNLIQQAHGYLDAIRQHSPRLFHNFAKLHPGIEHLGGTYKGGTYVLVYEEQFKFLEFPDGGILTEEVREDKVFRSEFDMMALFDDEEAGGEILMDVSFNPDLENKEMKLFLVAALDGITPQGLDSNELLGLRSSKVENIFPNYINALNKRGDLLPIKDESKLASDLILQLDELVGKASETVQGLLPSYVEYLADSYNIDLQKLGVSFGGNSVDSGPLVTKEELMRLTTLLVDILERMDDGFLGPDDFAELRQQHPANVWESYLAKAAAAMDKDLTPKLRASLTARFMEVLDSVDGNVLSERQIQPGVWELYKESIAQGSEFLPPQESDGLAAFKAFLMESYLNYGKLILSDSGIETLRRANVSEMWSAYLSLYAKSTGERFLDMDVQRSLLDGFLELLEKSDSDRAKREAWADELEAYIAALRGERARLDSADINAKPAEPDLLDILIHILAVTLSSAEGIKALGFDGSSMDLEFLRMVSLDAFWPTFETRLQKRFKEPSPGAIARLKAEYHQNLLIAVKKGVGFENGLTQDIQKYADYLAMAGPGENPYMRRAIIDVLKEMGGQIIGPDMLVIEGLSATAMWPSFLRKYIQTKGKPGDLLAAQDAQQAFVQTMMKYNVEKLQEQGIDAEWFRYAASLMAPIKEQEDYMGKVVQLALNAMMTVLDNGITPEIKAQLLTSQPEDLLDKFMASVLNSDNQPLLPKEEFKVRTLAVRAVSNTKVPDGSPKELQMLWEAYQNMLAPELPGPVSRKIVVADFSLPYLASETLDRLPAKVKPVARPQFVLQGDTAIVTPGASVDIRILDNDDLAGMKPADQAANIKVAIKSVVHAPGALGGVATLISDPKVLVPGAPVNVLRYEAFFGIPLEGGEISEITYEVTDTISGQTALGKVLILTRQPLGLISEPCCCCKDYTYMVTQGETLKIVDPFMAFADRAPFVLRLLKEDGSESTSISTPEFNATLLKNSLQVNSSLLFEGTVRLPYRVRYEGGKAHCEGMITVIVTCRCQLMPCEVTVSLTAGEDVEARNVLSPEEREEGLQVRLKGAGGQPVNLLNSPFPQIVAVKVTDFDSNFKGTILKVATDGNTSTSALVPFYKGVVEGENFVIHGECTLVILVNPTQAPCLQEYDIPANEATTLMKVLTSDEAAQGVELRYNHNGAPVYVLPVLPTGLVSASVVTVTGSIDPFQAFKVQPGPGFSGTVTFSFFKGTMKGDTFAVTSQCTMILHVLPPLVTGDKYTIMENETLVIFDLLSPSDIDSGLRLRFPTTNNTDSGGSLEFFSFNLRLADTGAGNTTVQTLPEGAASLELIAVAPKGVADTGFMLQPVLGYNGLITWNYEVYLLGGVTNQAVKSGSIQVTVLPVADFDFTYNLKPFEQYSNNSYLSEKEVADGWELKFFDGTHFVNNILLPYGVKALEIYKDESGYLSGWVFQSTPEFTGDIVFRVGAVEPNKGYLIGHRIYTVTVKVRLGSGPGPFLYNTNVNPDESIQLTDIISAEDMKAGMSVLRFADKSGAPVSVIPEMPLGLLEAFLSEGGPSNTLDSSLKVVTSSTSEGMVITIPMIKGMLGLSGFKVMQSGQVVLNVGNAGPGSFSSAIQLLPGRPAVVSDLMSEKDRANDIELRFVGKSEQPSLETNLPLGLNFLKIYANPADGAPNAVVVLNADGKGFSQLVIPMYKVKPSPAGDMIVNTGQLIVDFAYSVPFPSFADSRTVPASEKTRLEDLFSQQDKDSGINQLNFRWADGRASDQAEFLPAGLNTLAIADTPDAKYGLLGVLADGSQTYIQIPLYKGSLYESDFIPMSSGVLSLIIDKPGNLPTFEMQRTLVLGEKTDLTDLVTEQDVKAGMPQLYFADSQGNPLGGFYDTRLAFIYFTPFGQNGADYTALQLQAVQVGPIVVPMLRGELTPSGFIPKAIGHLVLDVVGSGNGGLPNYNYEFNFGQSPYYNIGEYEQYSAQFLLNGVQTNFENYPKDPNNAAQMILGNYMYNYQYTTEYLVYRIQRAPFFTQEQDFYMGVYTLIIDSLIEVTKAIGDVDRWGGLDYVFNRITDDISMLRNVGIMDLPVGEIFKGMLSSKTIPFDARQLGYYISNWNPPKV